MGKLVERISLIKVGNDGERAAVKIRNKTEEISSSLTTSSARYSSIDIL
jgi:hypothetical protein